MKSTGGNACPPKLQIQWHVLNKDFMSKKYRSVCIINYMYMYILVCIIRYK